MVGMIFWMAGFVTDCVMVVVLIKHKGDKLCTFIRAIEVIVN